MRCIHHAWPWIWPPASENISGWRWLTQVIAIASAIILSGTLGTHFTTIPGNVSAVWLPDGIALAAALIFGPQIWSGIFLGTFCFGLLSYSLTPLFFICLILLAIIDVLIAISTAALIQHFTQTPYPFNKTSDALVFIAFGVCLNQILDATIGTFLLSIPSIVAWSDVGIVLLTWWISGSAGIIIVTPTILTWWFLVYHPLEHKKKHQIQPINYELIVWLNLTFAICSISFWYNFSIEYLILVLLIWSVFRFSKPLTTLTILLVSLAAVVGTAQERSTFIREDINQSLLFLNSFIGTISITTLLLMAVLEERFQLVQKLEQSKGELEARVMQRTQALSVANAKLQKISTTDALTRCFNRLKMDEILSHNLALYHRYQQIFSVILIDLDYFKQVNDQYGHLIGDALLTEATHLFQSCLRSVDVLGRWGGEEFIIVCANTHAADANTLAEKLRETLASTYFEPVGYKTASFGVVECAECHKLPQDLVRHADEALYQAKATGRNCTVVYQSPMNPVNQRRE